MAHQMVYLGRPQDALELLNVARAAADKEREPTVRALVRSQTGRMYAALGARKAADTNLAEAEVFLAEVEQRPSWADYFDAAEHAGARAVSARDLTQQGSPGLKASDEFRKAIDQRGPGFERCRAMDMIGLTAALLDEGEPEQAAAAGAEALDLAERIDSALVVSRLNTLTESVSRYRTAETAALRERTEDVISSTGQATTVAA
ncbi:hypothetical protein OG948_13440 [Embleya sp. NBC_00888]|uniref:hypothetical protein n=1 Tax=Embleya sp. NBC_00888 TaxID=2975960 RepID=UPI003864DF7F|nr:hypothetical protein OG948_13440 [Embleya sp. NBC_00888]